MNYYAWAAKWGIPPAAIEELNAIFNVNQAPPPLEGVPRSEAYVQSNERIIAAREGIVAWRNNVGAFPETKPHRSGLLEPTGRWVRYGLANDSKQMNEVIKSPDLFGINPVLITQDMVGTIIGQAWFRECKEEGWTYKGTARENAQQNFHQFAVSKGADSKFLAEVRT